MPPDYLGYSVYGTRVVLESAGHTTVLNGTTNGYGHFEVVGSVPLSPDGRISLRLAGCEDWDESTTDSTIVPVPEDGLTIVSDVDDVLRVAAIWDWQEMFKNLFIRRFTPWLSMPKVYKAWRDAAPDAHFHYYSDAPEMSHKYYIEGLEAA